MITKIVIIYHSGFGHTEVIAKSVYDGCASTDGVNALLIKVEEIDQNWAELDAADGIIFGCPTYMGSSSAQFKMFMDASSKKWMQQAWKNKIAAGFTNSGSQSGDKLMTLTQLAVFAAQHGMVWVGNDIPGSTSGVDGLNRIGSWLGVMTQAAHAAPELSFPESDLATAKAFGGRVAEATQRWVRGEAV